MQLKKSSFDQLLFDFGKDHQFFYKDYVVNTSNKEESKSEEMVSEVHIFSMQKSLATVTEAFKTFIASKWKSESILIEDNQMKIATFYQLLFLSHQE